VVDLELGSLSLLGTTEELLERTQIKGSWVLQERAHTRKAAIVRFMTQNISHDFLLFVFTAVIVFFTFISFFPFFLSVYPTLLLF
jgi:hypothetical protein